MTIYYYIYRGLKYGSTNRYKIECMSARDSNGKVFTIDISYFTGHLLNDEWLG